MKVRMDEMLDTLRSMYEEWFEKQLTQNLEEDLNELLSRKNFEARWKETPEGLILEITLKSVRGKRSKKILLDKRFWDGVEYISFYPQLLCIHKKKRLPVLYLYDSFFETITNTQGHVDPKKIEFLSYLNICYYVFPDENETLLKYMWAEAKNRKKAKGLIH